MNYEVFISFVAIPLALGVAVVALPATSRVGWLLLFAAGILPYFIFAPRDGLLFIIPLIGAAVALVLATANWLCTRGMRKTAVVISPFVFTTPILLVGIGLYSAALEQELARVSVPDTNVTVVVTKDEKGFNNFYLLEGNKRVPGLGALRRFDPGTSPLPTVFTDGRFATLTWPARRDPPQYLKFDVRTCRIVEHVHPGLFVVPGDGIRTPQVQHCVSSIRKTERAEVAR